MLASLDNVVICGGCDGRVWKLVVKGNFFIKSLYNVLIDDSDSIYRSERFWDSTILSRVLAFCWVVRGIKFLL